MWRRISIGRAFRECQSFKSWCRYNKYDYISKTESLYYHHGFTSSDTSSSSFLSPLHRPSNYYEHHERKCEMEVETKVGSYFNLAIGTSNATKSWKELKKKNINYQKVTEGDVIDLPQFLFTENRDYLIRYQKVTEGDVIDLPQFLFTENRDYLIRYQKVTEGDVIDLPQFLFTENRDYLIRYQKVTEGDVIDLPQFLFTENRDYLTRYQKVTEGDVIDLRQFLFTENRDYLIRYNDKTQVKAEQLAGKVVILYFVSLSLHPLARTHERSNTSLLMNIYNHLRHSRDIEIVLIAIDDGNLRESEKRFEDIICGMPWTAIPFSDVICRRNLQLNFHVNDTTTSFVVDSTGLVLQRDARFYIKDYGVMGFPYSDERIKLLDAEDEAAVQQPSLITLLGSSQRDYVITNKGEKVPIHTLEGKVVALYFYEDGVCGYKKYIISVYEELARTKKNFEVVLVYVTDTLSTFKHSEEKFWKEFKTMPWLALPFKDPNIQKLKRIFEYCEAYDDEYFDERPSLVIFGPHGEFIEPLGNCILGEYPVYPFTCENVAKFETERVQNLKMEMLYDPDTIIKKIDGSQIKISQLAGKKVIIFFEMEERYENVHYFLVKLKDRYLELKGTDDEFEVIHILEKEMDPMLPIQDLPWFVSLASELLPDGFDFNESCGFDHHFRCLSTLLAFDQDGKLVRRTIFPAFEDTKFPFYAGSMEEEALSQLIDLRRWDYWNFYPNGGRIYTLHKKLRQPSCSLGGGYRVWSINPETS